MRISQQISSETVAAMASPAYTPRLLQQGCRRLLASSSKARWQSGNAADCKSVNAGSIPTRASNIPDSDSVISAGHDHVGTVVAPPGTQSLVLELGRGA